MFPKKWGLTTDMLVSAIQFNVRALTNDKTFCFFLGASALGVVSVAVPVVQKLKKKQLKLKAALSKVHRAAAASQANQPLSKRLKKKKKKKVADDLGIKFWQRLWKMLKICVPSWKCETARLLIVQFLFLVLRALLTVRLTQINVQLLTEAISRASWNKWARWLMNFVGWMGIGMSTNSALHFVEHCLRVAIRKQLTMKAHQLYMQNNFFYNANVMQSIGGGNSGGGNSGGGNGGSSSSVVSLDNLDQRITSDIYEFCFEIVGLYGHSFKPLLEFLLSLSAAMHDIGKTPGIEWQLLGVGLLGCWVAMCRPSNPYPVLVYCPFLQVSVHKTILLNQPHLIFCFHSLQVQNDHWPCLVGFSLSVASSVSQALELVELSLKNKRWRVNFDACIPD
jgi:hypothetical protein